MVRWGVGRRPVCKALTMRPGTATVADLAAGPPIPRARFDLPMRAFTRISALVLLLPGTMADAQSEPIAPSSLGRYVSRPSLGTSDLAVIQAYVDREVPRLISESPSEAVQGRTSLTEDLTSSSQRVSPVFREEYTAILEPHLREALDNEDLSAAVLSAQVAAVLGTDGAVKLLTDHVELRDEPRNAVRLWSVGGLANLISAPSVSEPRAIRAMRTVTRAARSESSWPVHRRALMVLAAGLGNHRGHDVGQEAVRLVALELLAEATGDTLDAVAEGRVDQVNGLPVVTGAMQNTLLMADTPEHADQLLETMVPVLSRGHESILAQWDAIRATPRTLESAARFLDESELLLTMLTDTPASGGQLSNALRSGDRRDVESAAQRWSRFKG